MFPLPTSSGSHSGPDGNFNPPALSTWIVEADLPPHPGFGLRRAPPSPEALQGLCPVSDGAIPTIAPSDRETRQGDQGSVLNGLWSRRRAALRGHLARARDFERRISRGHVDSAAALAAEEVWCREAASNRGVVAATVGVDTRSWRTVRILITDGGIADKKSMTPMKLIM